jgi:N-acetylglucosaminylphosphatidylinositol deacetylase
MRAQSLLSILNSLIFLITFSLLRTLFYSSTEFNNVFVQQQLGEHKSYAPNSRVLFLTAHPDDECMFFAPTILALTSKMNSLYPEMFSLCLSFGDADGLGTVRREELGRSLDVLGIGRDNRAAVDHP